MRAFEHKTRKQVGRVGAEQRQEWRTFLRLSFSFSGRKACSKLMSTIWASSVSLRPN